jgi:hypothetical protein
VCLIVALTSCSSFAKGSRPPRDIKVYSIQPTQDFCDPVEPWCQGKVGLVRKQSKEVKSFESSADYLALSPEDFQRIIQTCPQP